jgi:CheY-like chemotaxis protein
MRKKLLLADDSITIQKVVELTFPSDEFEVVTAGNGRLAVDKALTFLPDIVLCDVIMPQLDGYQVCEALRASEQLKNVPILLLNGAFEPYDSERAKAVGALGNVSKPFDPPALVSRVKALLAEQAAAIAASAPQPEPAKPEPMAPEPFAELEAEPEEIAATEVPLPAPTAPHDYAYEDETETNPVSTIEVPLDVREMAARSLSLDAPVFAEPEPDVLTGEPEPSDFSETLHGPLDAEVGAAEPFPEIEPVEEVSPTAEISMPHTEPFAPEPPPAGELDFETDTAQSMELAMPPIEAPAGPAELETPGSERELEPMELEPVAAVASTDPGLSGVPDFEPSPAEPEPEAPSAAPTVPAPPLEPEPEPEAPPAEAAGAFDGLVGPPDTPAAPPVAAPVAGAALPASEVAVPVDMVQQIAQRVISQVSERVIREIAWEVIPVIAEKLVKAEIERIKARAESERD